MNFEDRKSINNTSSGWQNLSITQRNYILIAMIVAIICAGIGIGLLLAKIVFILSIILVVISVTVLIITSIIWTIWDRKINKRNM